MTISLTGCKSTVSMVKNLFYQEEQEASILTQEMEKPQQDKMLRDTVLYYKDDKGFLIPVMRKIPWTEGIAKATLSALIDTPANREDIHEIGLLPVIPANTEIHGITINNGLCKIDFTGDFLNYSNKKEEDALINSIVYTLTEFPTIDNVQIMIDGRIHQELVCGTKINKPLTRDNINYIGTIPGKHKVVVYYESTTNGLETYFVPITKTIEKKEHVGVNVLDALDTLVQGPPEGLGLFSDIPKGTRVVGVDVNDSIAHINLTEEILEITENQEIVKNVVKSFGLTVKEQYKDIVGVKLFVNGEEIKIGDVKKEDPMVVPTFANQY
jgi:germination protein M